LSSGSKVKGQRAKVQSSKFKVQSSRFKVQGSKFKVQSSRFNSLPQSPRRVEVISLTVLLSPPLGELKGALRYTSFTTDKNISAKFQFLDKATS